MWSGSRAARRCAISCERPSTLRRQTGQWTHAPCGRSGPAVGGEPLNVDVGGVAVVGAVVDAVGAVGTGAVVDAGGGVDVVVCGGVGIDAGTGGGVVACISVGW